MDASPIVWKDDQLSFLTRHEDHVKEMIQGFMSEGAYGTQHIELTRDMFEHERLCPLNIVRIFCFLTHTQLATPLYRHWTDLTPPEKRMGLGERRRSGGRIVYIAAISLMR